MEPNPLSFHLFNDLREASSVFVIWWDWGVVFLFVEFHFYSSGFIGPSYCCRYFFSFIVSIKDLFSFFFCWCSTENSQIFLRYCPCLKWNLSFLPGIWSFLPVIGFSYVRILLYFSVSPIFDSYISIFMFFFWRFICDLKFSFTVSFAAREV